MPFLCHTPGASHWPLTFLPLPTDIYLHLPSYHGTFTGTAMLVLILAIHSYHACLPACNLPAQCLQTQFCVMATFQCLKLPSLLLQISFPALTNTMPASSLQGRRRRALCSSASVWLFHRLPSHLLQAFLHCWLSGLAYTSSLASWIHLCHFFICGSSWIVSFFYSSPPYTRPNSRWTPSGKLGGQEGHFSGWPAAIFPYRFATSTMEYHSPFAVLSPVYLTHYQ